MCEDACESRRWKMKCSEHVAFSTPGNSGDIYSSYSRSKHLYPTWLFPPLRAEIDRIRDDSSWPVLLSWIPAVVEHLRGTAQWFESICSIWMIKWRMRSMRALSSVVATERNPCGFLMFACFCVIVNTEEIQKCWAQMHNTVFLVIYQYSPTSYVQMMNVILHNWEEN